MPSNPDQKTILDYLPLSAYDRIDLLKDRRAKDVHRKLSVLFSKIMTMWTDKVNAYGVERYEVNDLPFDAWMSFTGVWRKHQRLEQLTRSVSEGDKDALRAIIDAYADSALYSLSAIVVLSSHLEEE